MDEYRIRGLLKRIDDLRREAEELLPKPEPKPLPKPEPQPVAAQLPRRPSPPPPPSLIADWLSVRGRFAPEGMTREFAVATRWLTRIGAVLLVGAIAYFMMLAIDRGWVGPTQRVCGMMFWGVAGTVAGTWIKVRKERYAILGEVFAALGLVGLYFAFGLGHRYFRPPVIASGWTAFFGLAVTTLVAGVLSVRLRSLMIAGLGLFGGFLVPTICSFTGSATYLESYLLLLAFGACTVAYFRKWSACGFIAIAVSYVMAQSNVGAYGHEIANVSFATVLYLMAFALTALGVRRRSDLANGCCWLFVALMTIAWMTFCLDKGVMRHLMAFFFSAAALHAVLAALCRRLNLGGAPVMIVAATLFAVGGLVDLCAEAVAFRDFVVPIFCAFAIILSELGGRTKERTLGAMSVLMTIGCLIAWQVAMMQVAAAFRPAEDLYWGGFAVRGLKIGVFPIALAVLAKRRYGGLLSEDGKWMVYVAAAIAAFFPISLESSFFEKAFLPALKGGFVTLVWSVIATSLLANGIVRRMKAWRIAGLVVLALSVGKVLLCDSARLATPGRVTVFAVVGALLIAGAFLYMRFRTEFEERS